MIERCFFVEWDEGPCNGRLVRAHLIPRQLLKREFPHGALLEDGCWRKATRYEDRYDLPYRSAVDLWLDPRSWVPCCGGPTGIGGHHGALDHARTLRIDWTELPLSFIEFCDEYGLAWWAEREYGSHARRS